MESFNFSDTLLETSFKVLAFSMCETESEKEAFKIICEICRKYDLSVRKYMMVFDELQCRLKELENNDVKD